MITDYIIISEISRLDIEDSVKKALLDGWIPLGGICVSPNCNFYQAMVKKEKQI